MLIDTHCHIYLEQFEDDIDEVLQRAAKADVRHIFMPAISFESLPKMNKIRHPEITFHKMAGIHPTEINEGVSATEQQLFERCEKTDIVAVGETGLDYYWNDDYKDEQQKSLHLHCEVAKSLGKPVVLHNRESTGDLLDIIEQQQDGRLDGIWHCFTGTANEGRRAIDLGLELGIGGVFTFKNAGVDKAVAQLPLDNMLLETDAPYLAPHPKRGKRNEPSFVQFTARRLAEVMGVSLEQVASRTTENAFDLFGITPDQQG